MKNLITLLSLAIMCLASSCKTSSTANENSSANPAKGIAVSIPVSNSKPTGNSISPSNAIPKATAFRMNGDYAGNVAVSIDSEGNLTYFPAPTDISSNSEPLKLTDGWYLNRQGIGIHSVFTKYTFSEYAALPKVPSVADLKAAIIPDARVTEVIQLPYSINEAQSHLSEINEFLRKVNTK